MNDEIKALLSRSSRPRSVAEIVADVKGTDAKVRKALRELEAAGSVSRVAVAKAGVSRPITLYQAR